MRIIIMCKLSMRHVWEYIRGTRCVQMHVPCTRVYYANEHEHAHTTYRDM